MTTTAAQEAAEQRDADGIDGEAIIDGELQHQIRNGTLFGIGLLGGIGGLDGYGLAAAAAASAGGEDWEGGGRQKREDTESNLTDVDEQEEVKGFGDEDADDDDADSGSGSDANSDANSEANSDDANSDDANSDANSRNSGSGLEGEEGDDRGPAEAAMTSVGEEMYATTDVYEAEDGEGEGDLEDSKDNVSSKILLTHQGMSYLTYLVGRIYEQGGTCAARACGGSKRTKRTTVYTAKFKRTMLVFCACPRQKKHQDDGGKGELTTGEKNKRRGIGHNGKYPG